MLINCASPEGSINLFKSNTTGSTSDAPTASNTTSTNESRVNKFTSLREELFEKARGVMKQRGIDGARSNIVTLGDINVRYNDAHGNSAFYDLLTDHPGWFGNSFHSTDVAKLCAKIQLNYK